MYIVYDYVLFNICIYIICKKLTLLTQKEFVKFASSLSNVQFKYIAFSQLETQRISTF